MEIIDLENIWKEYDKKIADNTRINKEILKRMLVVKPEKRVNWIKLKAGINLFSPIIMAAILWIMDVKIILSVNFYIGLSIFMTTFIVNYVWNVKYYLLIRKIVFSKPILTIKKDIAQIEKYKIKTTKARYIFMPFAIIGIFLMIIQRPVLNFESAVMIILVIIVFISSILFTFKYSIYERFSRLNREIEEIEMLEN